MTDTSADTETQPTPSEANAEAAQTAARALLAAYGDRFTTTDTAKAAEAASVEDVTDLITCALHLADLAGAIPAEVAAEAIRHHAAEADAEDEHNHNAPARCRRCGGTGPRGGRWFALCLPCQPGYRTPELGGPDNEARAGWAEAAAQVYAAITRRGGTFPAHPGDEAEEILGDLNADLRHLARRCEVEPEAIEDRGRGHFEAEEDEEADESDQDTAD